MKKLLALLLVLTMVAALGTTAFADDAKVGKTVLKVAFNLVYIKNSVKMVHLMKHSSG